MAYASSALLADTSTTIREDLTDYISVLSPVDTPLLSMLEHESVSNVSFDWLMDTIPFTPAIQASKEGADFNSPSGTLGENPDMFPTAAEASYRRTRASNITHILRKAVSVSDTERAVAEAGVEDEYTYQIVRMALSLAKQMEYNLHFSAYQDGSGGNGYARRMHGLASWILSTGAGNVAVTIAGKSIPQAYSSTVYYTPTDLSLIDGGAVNGLLTSAVAPNAPFLSRFDATTGLNGSYTVGDTIPRVRVHTVTTPGAPALTVGVYVGTSAVLADAGLNLGTATDYGATAAGVADLSNDLTSQAFYDYMLSPAHDKGMNIGGSVLLCGSKVKHLISQFALITSGSGATATKINLNERNVGASEKTLWDTIDVFQTEFGPVYMNLDRYMNDPNLVSTTGTPAEGFFDASYSNGKYYSYRPAKSCLLIEPDFWKIALLRGLSFSPLAKIGDSSNGMLVMEASLKALNPIAGIGGFGIAA